MVEHMPREQTLGRSRVRSLLVAGLFFFFLLPYSPNNECVDCPKSGPSRRYISTIYELNKKILFLAGTNFAKISQLVIVKTAVASYIKSKKLTQDF